VQGAKASESKVAHYAKAVDGFQVDESRPYAEVRYCPSIERALNAIAALAGDAPVAAVEAGAE
jgi:hypothetical protein